MRHYIKVEADLRDKICAAYSVSLVQVWRALNFLRNSEQAKDIRQFALAGGGQYVQEHFCPNCESQHTADAIIQTFPCGVSVRISKVDSSATLIVDGSVEESYEAISAGSWANLLAHAQEISDAKVRSL